MWSFFNEGMSLAGGGRLSSPSILSQFSLMQIIALLFRFHIAILRSRHHDNTEKGDAYFHPHDRKMIESPGINYGN